MQVTKVLKSKDFEDTDYEIKAVKCLDNKMHYLFENLLGLCRRNVNWNSDDVNSTLECWKEGDPCGYSRLVELEKFYNIAHVFSTEVCNR